MPWLSHLVTALGGYLLGSIPTGYVVARARGIDIRQVGSGNIGATNVFRILGRTAGVAVLLIDRDLAIEIAVEQLLAHNLENVLAAALIARLLGVPAPSIRRSVLAFRGLEHRLEDVLRVEGVRSVNDYKATTVDATLKALASFDRPIVLILGGRGKGGDFSPLRREVGRRARSVVLVGEAADKIEAALDGVVPVDRVSTYRDVVRKAFEKARRGDVVLLAPACTSWDMFKNFEERGRTFKAEVRRLAAGLRKREDGA